jgi:hypothetical protein
VKRFVAGPLQVTLGVMMTRPTPVIATATLAIARATLAIAMLLATAGAGWPQAAVPPPSLGIQEPGVQPAAPPPAAPAPAAPAREENPGLINEIGKLFDKLPSLKSPQETIEDFNSRAREAAKGASDSLSNLARPSSMVYGRAICPVAANGSPDCKLGADKLCQSKGYKEGKSLITDAAQSCSAKVLIPGRTRKPDDCHTDNFVTSALCQ